MKIKLEFKTIIFIFLVLFQVFQTSKVKGQNEKDCKLKFYSTINFGTMNLSNFAAPIKGLMLRGNYIFKKTQSIELKLIYNLSDKVFPCSNAKPKNKQIEFDVTYYKTQNYNLSYGIEWTNFSAKRYLYKGFSLIYRLGHSQELSAVINEYKFYWLNRVTIGATKYEYFINREEKSGSSLRFTILIGFLFPIFENYSLIITYDSNIYHSDVSQHLLSIGINCSY